MRLLYTQQIRFSRRMCAVSARRTEAWETKYDYRSFGHSPQGPDLFARIQLHSATGNSLISTILGLWWPDSVMPPYPCL